MRMRPTTTLLVVFALASGFAFALPAVDQQRAQTSNALPVWVTEGKPGTGPVFLVRGQVGSGEDSHAGYAWLSELERFHIAWGGAVAGAQDVVFMIEAPDHDKLDALLASGPWSQVKFTVEPLVRTKDRLTRTQRTELAKPSVPPEPGITEAPANTPTRPIADPNHGDGTTHPAP
ncbi:MAG: hypothetical protein RLY21_661 [Planctomycetota bacterium]|jgi:hypothetical protein